MGTTLTENSKEFIENQKQLKPKDAKELMIAIEAVLEKYDAVMDEFEMSSLVKLKLRGDFLDNLKQSCIDYLKNRTTAVGFTKVYNQLHSYISNETDYISEDSLTASEQVVYKLMQIPATVISKGARVTAEKEGLQEQLNKMHEAGEALGEVNYADEALSKVESACESLLADVPNKDKIMEELDAAFKVHENVKLMNVNQVLIYLGMLKKGLTFNITVISLVDCSINIIDSGEPVVPHALMHEVLKGTLEVTK